MYSLYIRAHARERKRRKKQKKERTENRYDRHLYLTLLTFRNVTTSRKDFWIIERRRSNTLMIVVAYTTSIENSTFYNTDEKVIVLSARQSQRVINKNGHQICEQ